jgi:hypothetical protein
MIFISNIFSDILKMTKNKIAKIAIKHNNSVNNSQTKTKLSEIVDT